MFHTNNTDSLRTSNSNKNITNSSNITTLKTQLILTHIRFLLSYKVSQNIHLKLRKQVKLNRFGIYIIIDLSLLIIMIIILISVLRKSFIVNLFIKINDFYI